MGHTGATMNKRLYIVLGILLIAAFSWAISQAVRQPREPVFDGKPLRYWLGARAPQPITLSNGLAWQRSYSAWLEQDTKDSDAVPFLIQVLKRDRWLGAAYYRKRLWPKLPPSLQKRLPRPPAGNSDARRNAAMLLAGMGPIAKSSVPTLIQALKVEEDTDVRVFDAFALGCLGKGNKSAVAALRQATNDENPFVRESATNALHRLDFKTDPKTDVKPPAP
jgi:hypothetical protein